MIDAPAPPPDDPGPPVSARIRARLLPPDWLPAPAQGAIAIECRDGDVALHAVLSALDDAPTRRCVEAERAMNRALHGSCHVPVAAFAREAGDGGLHLQGLVGGVADGRLLRAEAHGGDGDALGREVARRLLDAGAGELLGAPA